MAKIYRWSKSIFDRVRDVYDRSLLWALNHRRVILGLFVASMLASYGLYRAMSQDFLPSDDTGLIMGNIQTITGTSYDQLVAYTVRVTNLVERDPNIAYVHSDEGGSLIIALKPLSQRRLSADEVIQELRRKLRDIPGTSITFVNPPSVQIGARSARSSYQYTLQGLDLGELQQTASQLVQELQKDPTFVGVNSDQDRLTPSVHVAIDRGRAASLGITPDQIQNTLDYAFGGQQVSQIYASTDQYQVILELLPQYQLDPTASLRLYLRSASGAMVPLTAVARITSSATPLTINHSGEIPAITISFDLAPGRALSDAVAGVEAAVNRVGLPASIQGGFAGTAAAFESSTCPFCC